MNPSRRIGNGWRTAVAGACALVWMGFAGVACGATANGGLTVAAHLADSSVEAGQNTEYRIDVVGGRADRAPAAPTVDGLQIAYSGQTSSTQIDFNSLTRTTTTSYVYAVETTRAGRFVIPGQEVSLAGTFLRTLPVTLTVGDNGQGAAPAAKQTFVELLVPKKTAYLGESIPVEVRTYFAANVPAQLTPDLVLNGEGFSVGKFTPQRDVGQQMVDGTPYRAAAAKSFIAGLKTGTLSVGPVEVDPYVQLPRPRPRTRRNDPFDMYFNNGFGGMNVQPPQQVKLLSAPVPVEIKPLPAQGRPTDFSGAIGQFKLDVEAEPKKAQAGDPITVHLLLSGRGNFDRVGAPALADDRGLRTYPATFHFKADDEVNLSGVKTFDQVVIAEGPRTTLPSYRFNYFDPVTGKYVVLDTPPLAVRVEGGVAQTPVPAPPLASAGTPPPSVVPTPTPAPRRTEDILYIRPDEGRRLRRDAFLPAYRQRAFWVAQGGGLATVLVLGAAGLLRTRARNDLAQQMAARQRQQGDLQRALQRQETGRREFYSAATRLAQMRAVAATGRADDYPGAQEICRDQRLDPQTAGSVEEMFRRHDELAYSGGSVAQEPVPLEERRGVLAALETLGRNPRA